MNDIIAGIHEHLARFWPNNRKEAFVWDLGPIRETLPNWQVIRVAPTRSGEPWQYVTVGASSIASNGEGGLEFILSAPEEDPIHIETLAMVSNFHADPRYRVHYGKVIDIGRPWVDDSRSTHFLVSHPYPQGPDFEYCCIGGKHVRFLWLMPITSSERKYLERNGQEALERRFEDAQINSVDPHRPSVA